MNPFVNPEGMHPGMAMNYPNFQYNPQSAMEGQGQYHQYVVPSTNYQGNHGNYQEFMPVQYVQDQVYYSQHSPQMPLYGNNVFVPSTQPVQQTEYHSHPGGQRARRPGDRRGRGSVNYSNYSREYTESEYYSNNEKVRHNRGGASGNTGSYQHRNQQSQGQHANNNTPTADVNTPSASDKQTLPVDVQEQDSERGNKQNKQSKYNNNQTGNADVRSAGQFRRDDRQWQGRSNWTGNYHYNPHDFRGRGRGGRYNRGGWGRGGYHSYPQNYHSRFSSRIDAGVMDERLRDTPGNSTDNVKVNSSDQADHKQFESRKNNIKFKDSVQSRGYEKGKSADEDTNWRRREGDASTRAPSRGKGRNQSFQKHGMVSAEDAESQRGLLIEQLGGNSYECMVCCDIVRYEAAIWSCTNCFHVFHLRCVKRWARSPAAAVDGATGWRCPACQNVSESFPHHYYCFCGKRKDPEFSRYDTPHSCGENCSKLRPMGCTHPCNILCHPGPCPACHASVTKKCNCGSTTQTVKCGQTLNIQCSKICSKTLNCGKHECGQICHSGACQPCEVSINQTCYCEQTARVVVCGTAESFVRNFSCQEPCPRDLDCGNHKCDKLCHPGSCESCKLLPSAVTHCPCGKVRLCELTSEDQGQRSACTDPIPTCSSVCGKQLACGPEEEHHTCRRLCHEGVCGPCEGQTEVTCHCGSLTKDIPCQEAIAFSVGSPFTCDKRCNKKRSCGRHRCAQQCCTETEHPCDMVCGRKLTCSLHRCEEPCHRGNCPTCWHVSFEELNCHCGAEVLFPPIPCGTRPPECRKSCQRSHSCDHTVRHNCHSDENCPPCTFLTEKWCMGKHELRKNIPCHLVDISCGLPCGKPLPCGLHKCQTICHKDACLPTEDEECHQPCTKKREDCGHPCGAPCHGDDPCPRSPCQAEITLKCKCGNKTGRALCLQGGDSKDIAQDYQKMATLMMAMKMADVQDGQGIDITGFTTQSGPKGPRVLECTKDCAVAERNKRLAEAFDIKNPDQGKLTSTPYTQFLKDYTKQNSAFIANIEKAFGELVQKAQMSKQARRSHAFPPMSRDQRRAVHELAEYYGCQTQSYDEEPKKNVVASAQKDKCWMPNVTLTSLMQRELHRKAPIPIPHGVRESEVRTVADTIKQSTDILGGSRSGSWASKVQSAAKPPPPPVTTTPKPKPSGLATLTKKKEEPVVDYFDMTS